MPVEKKLFCEYVNMTRMYWVNKWVTGPT